VGGSSKNPALLPRTVLAIASDYVGFFTQILSKGTHKIPRPESGTLRRNPEREYSNRPNCIGVVLALNAQLCVITLTRNKEEDQEE
jgi:hypothetical protein